MRKRVSLDKRGLVSKVALGTGILCTLAMVWPDSAGAVVLAIGSDDGWGAIGRVTKNVSPFLSMGQVLWATGMLAFLVVLLRMRKRKYRVSN